MIKQAWNVFKGLKHLSAGLPMPTVTTPTAPASGLTQYAQVSAGRAVLKLRSALGIHRVAVDPVYGVEVIILPNATTTIGAIGNSVTSVGTISHPTVTTAIGRAAAFTSSAGVGATAGTGSSSDIFLRGNSTGAYQGFSLDTLLTLPDASYNNTGASTGSRIFVGFTNQTMAASVASDDPAGNFCGFFRCHVNGGLTHTNWQFATKNGSTISIVDTGLAFTATNMVEIAIYNPPGSGTIYWTIRDVTSGSASFSGSTSTNVPTALTLMKAGFQVQTVNATARTILMSSFRARGLLNQV